MKIFLFHMDLYTTLFRKIMLPLPVKAELGPQMSLCLCSFGCLDFWKIMKKWIEESKKFLRRYKTEGQAFLDRIITVDETWISNYDPESKQTSVQWRRSKSPLPKKANRVSSIFDSRGIILSHMVPRGKPVNAKYYSKVNWQTKKIK